MVSFLEGCSENTGIIYWGEYDETMKLKAIFHVAEEGGFWAEVPALPGCVTQGETMEELKRNLTEAVEGWLLAAEPDDSIPSDSLLEVAV